jgi:hypothetical protein
MNNAEFPDRNMGCGIRQIVARLALAAIALAAAAASVSCQSAGQPSFPANPTDSGSRYSDFNLPGSNMGMQNTDLED